MAIKVNIDLGYEFAVKADFATVFDTLSDVPTSASYFPKVEQLVDLGKNTFRWEMAKIGLAQANLQTVYASKYTSNKAKGSVVWTKKFEPCISASAYEHSVLSTRAVTARVGV